MSPTVMTAIVFLCVTGLVLLGLMLLFGRDQKLEARLDELAGKPARGDDHAGVARMAKSALPKVGKHLMPEDEAERTLLRTRLIHAGFYGRQATAVFLGAKMMLMVGPALLGFLLGALRVLPGMQGMLVGGCAGIVGMIGPGMWLDKMKARRRTAFRRALPDALDLIVICVEGGLSLTDSLRRVTGELRTAHPILASEFDLVQREIQLGRTAGDALKQMGDRTDLEEIRMLASVIVQSERFGASLAKSLRVLADTLRLKRQQMAEELAQKAGTKVLFPTLLFIFPAIFVVILGPAAIHMMETLGKQ